MKVLAIDLGEKRTGLAVSEGKGFPTVGLPLFYMKGDGADADRLSERIAEEAPDRLVIGLPVNMDGTEGPAAERVRAFAADLEGLTGLQIDFHDERLTSEEAASRLRGLPISRKRKKEHINTVSAQVLLESYISTLS